MDITSSEIKQIDGYGIPSLILKEAQKKCLKSNMRHKMSAITFIGEHIIGRGFNKMLSFGQSIQSRDGNGYSEHAEVSCIHNSPRSELNGASIFIYRANGRCSKPCRDCWDWIIKVGIKYVYWVDTNGMIVEQRTPKFYMPEDIFKDRRR